MAVTSTGEPLAPDSVSATPPAGLPRCRYTPGAATFALHAIKPLNLDRQTNGDVQLVATIKIDALAPGRVTLGMDCGRTCGASVPVDATLATLPKGQWLRVGMSLKCFHDAGADMARIDVPFRLETAARDTISITHVALGTNADHVLPCPKP